VKARNLLELPEERVAPLMQRVHRLAKATAKALRPDGITVTQFNGEPAGQTIFHLHFHIIPRYEGVRLAGHGHSNRADIPELQQIASEIAAAVE
jgi:histidine triad (HIT) family protein